MKLKRIKVTFCIILLQTDKRLIFERVLQILSVLNGMDVEIYTVRIFGHFVRYILMTYIRFTHLNVYR